MRVVTIRTPVSLSLGPPPVRAAAAFGAAPLADSPPPAAPPAREGMDRFGKGVGG